MTTKCPDAIGNKKVQRLSEHTNQSDLFLSLPVFDITTKLTYRNRFCAICNGATNITYWKFSAEECDNTKLKLFMNKTTLMESIARYCKSYSYNLPTLSVMKHLKYCLVNKEKSCSRNNSLNTGVWNLNKQLCRSYSFPVYTSNGTFLKNPNCAWCEKKTPHKCYHEEDAPSSLSILFDFSSDQHYTANVKDNEGTKATFNFKHKKCKTNFAYNPLSQKCLNIVLNITELNKVNVTHIADCSSPVLINESDVTKLLNGSIYVKPHNKTYNRTRYYQKKDKYIVCSSFSPNFINNITVFGTTTKQVREIAELQFITFIGGGLSALGLSILLAVYSWFSELRNLPGKIVISLSGTVLIYQVCFFLTGQTERRGVCSAVAIVLHYFLLASFTWMSVMAFDLALTFASKGKTLIGGLILHVKMPPSHQTQPSENSCSLTLLVYEKKLAIPMRFTCQITIFHV